MQHTIKQAEWLGRVARSADAPLTAAMERHALLAGMDCHELLPKDLQFSLLVMGMALEIADESARTDIESNCAECVLYETAGRWWDTSALSVA